MARGATRQAACPPRGYTGQYQDSSSSGLDYYGARYYDPVLGQFTSADTVLAGGLNRYGYVGGNPTTASDPSGHGRVQELQEGAVPVTIATRTPNVFDYAGDGWGNGIWVGTNTYCIGPQYGYGSGLTTGPSMYSALPGGGYWVLTPLPYGGYAGAAYYPGYAGYDYVAQTYAALAAAGQSPQYVNMAILASLHSSQSSMTLWDWLDTGAVREAAAQASGQSQSGPTGGTELHRQTQTGGGGSFGGGSFGSGAPPLGTGGTCEGGESFAADTLVATPSGERPISSLRVGDQVEAYDPATGTTSVQHVEHVFINRDSDLLDVTLHVQPAGSQAAADGRGAFAVNRATRAGQRGHDETVHTTALHPWLTNERGWVRAGTLHIGEAVVTAGGDGATATVVALRVVAGAGDMWDLTVSNVHTFLVGAGTYVVHNCPPPPGSGGSGRPPKVPHPPLPPGAQNLADFGHRIMQWGRGDSDAIARIGNLSADFLRGEGVTSDLATQWADWYRYQVLRDPRNPSAAGRAQLMDWAAQLLS